METNKLTFILLALIGTGALCFESTLMSVEDEEESGSIEIPERPENRQGTTQDAQKEDKSFLNLISKIVGSFKGTLQNRSKFGKKSDVKYLVQKTKKALNSVNKAYAHVKRARKKLLKNGFRSDVADH